MWGRNGVAKGCHVAKYITKYGAGQSVHARIASLLDDIICRQPDDRTMTVASLLSKAFIATAVPDTLSALEAWHILWQLSRSVRSRYFKGLNMDGVTSLKMPAEVPKEEEGLGEERADWWKKRLNKATAVELYKDREAIPCKDPALQAALPGYSRRIYSWCQCYPLWNFLSLREILSWGWVSPCWVEMK